MHRFFFYRMPTVSLEFVLQFTNHIFHPKDSHIGVVYLTQTHTHQQIHICDLSFVTMYTFVIPIESLSLYCFINEIDVIVYFLLKYLREMIMKFKNLTSPNLLSIIIDLVETFAHPSLLVYFEN